MKQNDKKPVIISHQPVRFETHISKGSGCGDGGGGGGWTGSGGFPHV